MTAAHRFAYAQARIQARFAGLPAEHDWQRLAGARLLAGYLEEARGGALKDWVKGFSAQSTSADIERGLRVQFADSVDFTASVLPAPWRPAIAWCRWLPLLPLIAHLRSGHPPPGWAAADPALAVLAEPDRADADLRALLAAPADAGDDDGDGDGDGDDAGPWTIWYRHWQARWPRCGAGTRGQLEALAAQLLAHRGAFIEASPDKAWVLRKALRERLRLEMHRHLLTPVTPFLYLALVALDLERLRRALLDRALFPNADRREAA